MYLRLLQFLGQSKQESIGLPDCASCSAVDILAADVRIQSHCDVLNKRDLSSSFAVAETFSEPVFTEPTAGPFTSSLGPTTIIAPSELTAISTQILSTSVAVSSIPSTTATAVKATTPSAISSTTATAAEATAISISTPAAASSIQAPSGLSQSAKIGLGLGVPLGVIVLALLGCALFWFGKRRGKSPGNDMVLINSDTEKKDPVDAGPVKPILEGGELHGQHIVPRPNELAGSPGSLRKELP